MMIRIANTDFDRVSYDAERGVLFLSAGNPARARDYDVSREGHALRSGPEGELVGITIVDACAILDAAGRVRITLPEQVSAEDLAPALAGAS